MNKNTFCSHCGTKFAEQKLYPRKCFHCYNDTYLNPIPAVVGLIPVFSLDQIGIIKIRRGIEPHLGEWCLPGGYVDFGENWDVALQREIKEEVGIDVVLPTALLGIEKSYSKNLIIFGMTEWIEKLPNFIPNDEVLEIGLYSSIEEELAFPTHTVYARRELDKLLALAPYYL